MMPCFANEYKTLKGVMINNSSQMLNYPNYYDKYVLNDGLAIRILSADSDNDVYGRGVLSVWVDTNSSKGPNVIGRDAFKFELYIPKNLFLPYGTMTKDANGNTQLIKLSDKYTGDGYEAGAYLLRDGKMNY